MEARLYCTQLTVGLSKLDFWLHANFWSTGYLASYLIIKQLRSRHKHAGLKEDEDEEEDDSSSSIASKCDSQPYRRHDDEERPAQDDIESYHNKARDTYYQSIDGTVVASITAVSTSQHSYLEGDDEKLCPLPRLPPFEKKTYSYLRKNSATQLLEEADLAIETLAIREMAPESPKLAIPKADQEK